MSGFGVCIESSHKMGMGHFFRALNIIEFLKQKKKKYILFLNVDDNSISILKKKKICFETVDLDDTRSNWESVLIKKYDIDFWINDRLETKIEHAHNVKRNNVMLITFDDRGSGAAIADINFGSLAFNFNYPLKGINVFKGTDYLILNKEIDNFRRLRKKGEKIIVSLGGSDTYGVTLKVIEILKNKHASATIIIGPNFKHRDELNSIADKDFRIIDNVPSIIKEFYDYDLAITGGGITPFEANASGLPCIIIANELAEVDNGLLLQNIGSSVFAGYYKELDTGAFKGTLDIEKMSNAGLNNLGTSGIENIYMQIEAAVVKNN
ncbi:MAG: glycosyl transferase [Candidatus Omnitrophica bacterium]|nr:glycosyl transferase [Candidatus Omnitrophota bacterium]